MAASSDQDHQREEDISETDLWQPLIVECVASFLPPNVVACTLRLVNKATHDQFRTCSRVDLGLPCPEHAFAARWGVAGALRSLTFELRRKLLIRTAASGSIPNLKVAFRAIAATLTDEALDPDALAPGQLCPWLQDRGCWWLDEVLTGAAVAGQQEMCQWLLASGCPCSIAAVFSAVRGGHPGLMDLLFHQRPDLRAKVDTPALREAALIAAAAEGCNLAALKQLCSELMQGQGGQQQQPDETPPPPPINLLATIATAAGSSTPDWRAKVEWLEGLGSFSKFGPVSFRAVLSLPDAVERLTWLRSRGYAVGARNMLAEAVRAGNAAAVEHLLGEARATEALDRAALCLEAASKGHLSVLQTLHDRGFLTPGPDGHGVSRQVLRGALEAAVHHGHAAVASWLVDTFGVTGAELQEVMATGGVMDDGAVPGSIQMAEWLQGRGCHWSAERWVTVAAVVGCEELLEFALAGLDPDQTTFVHAYKSAVEQGDIATLRCLHRLGVPMTGGHDVYGAVGSLRYNTVGMACSDMRTLDGKCQLAVLRCLHSQLRYPWSPTNEIFTRWAFRDDRPLAILRWLVEEVRCPVDWEAAERSAERAHVRVDVWQWLQAQKAAAAPGRLTAGWGRAVQWGIGALWDWFQALVWGVGRSLW